MPAGGRSGTSAGAAAAPATTGGASAGGTRGGAGTAAPPGKDEDGRVGLEVYLCLRLKHLRAVVGAKGPNRLGSTAGQPRVGGTANPGIKNILH